MADNPEYEVEEIKFSELSSSDEESEFKSHRDYQYRVRVKYQIEGQTERLSSSWFNFFRYGYATFKAMLSPVDERVRPLDNNRQEVTIDFFITKDEYKSLHGYNLKKGAKLSASKLAPSLKEKIENWMSIKNNLK